MTSYADKAARRSSPWARQNPAVVEASEDCYIMVRPGIWQGVAETAGAGHAIGASGRGYSHAEIAKSRFLGRVCGGSCVSSSRSGKSSSPLWNEGGSHSIATGLPEPKKERCNRRSRSLRREEDSGKQVLAIKRDQQAITVGSDARAASGTVANGDIGKPDSRLSTRDGTAKIAHQARVAGPQPVALRCQCHASAVGG